MSRKYWILIVVLILVGAGGFFWYKKNQKKSVDFEIVQKGSIVESVYGIGTLTAERSFSIKSGVTSSIHKLYVKEGQVVTKGTVLLELEGIGNYTAPFAGTIVSAPSKTGEIVYPQSNIMTLVDPSRTYLLVTLEQQGALGLRANLPVKISFDGLRDQVFDGQVDSLFSNGTDFLAHISIKDLPQFILPGMTADVAIILQEKHDVLLVPVASLEGQNVVLNRNGKTLRVPVKLGLVDGVYAEVISGDINSGDQTVLNKRKNK